MADEMFDVVDELDRVIGQQLRREVHRLGLRHRAVHVLIFNAQGEVFLQKRSRKKDCFPGTWDSSASGHLCPGEPYDEAAVREVGEELGITLPCVPTRLFKIDACPETGNEFVWIYRCRHDGPFRLDPEEVETGGWYSAKAVTAWADEQPSDFAPSFLLIWRMLAASHSQPGPG